MSTGISKRVESEDTKVQSYSSVKTARTYGTLPTDRIFSIDVYGPESSGKTHLACTFPGDIVFIDTELKAETVIPKFSAKKNIFWKPAETWDDVVWAVNDALSKPAVKTIVFDSGGDLVSLAAEAWCKENGKKSVYPPNQYQHVYTKIDDLTGKIKAARKYQIATSRMKDEWVNDAPTGRKIRDGYKRLTWDYHLCMEITWGIRDENNKVWFPERKFGKVFKNGFWNVDEAGVQWGKPYLFSVSFDGISKELTNPWGAGVPSKDQLKRIVEEARAQFEPGYVKPAPVK